MRWARRIAALVFALFVALPILALVLFRFLPVPTTPQMILSWAEGKGAHHDWEGSDDISPWLSRAVIASEDQALVQEIQASFSGPTFRVYGSCDPTGVEIGGALKNVIAIGAGISDGLGLGHNAVAALITRGLAELTRLAIAVGANAETMSGLAGLGDLVLTCTGDLSRNRQVGLKLAAGLELGSILNSTPMVAEGVTTTSVALKLAALHGVDLPIAAEMHAVLNQGRSPASSSSLAASK